MVRGTFANIRLRNLLGTGRRGRVTRYLPIGRTDVRFSTRRSVTRADGTPLIVLAGKGVRFRSSRDWAAKGSVSARHKAAIAESFERTTARI